MSHRPDVWTAANDGSGSNLDADKLDNLSSADFELALGNPASDGYHLVSTAAGARSWEAVAGGGGAYVLMRRDGFSAVTARETIHWIGGDGIAISFNDDAGEDETEVTIDVEATVTQTDDAETITGGWTFDGNDTYVANGAFTGFLNFSSAADGADHSAIWSLENAAAARIWGMYKSATTTNLRLNRTASNTKVWEIALTTGIMDFVEIPTVVGVDVMLVGDAPTAATIESHSDVTISGIASGELLKWNGSIWINQTLAEAGIASSTHTVSSHSDVTITSIIDNELLQWNDSAGDWENKTLAEMAIGNIQLTTVVTGAWNFTTATLKIGGSAGSPDLSITDDGTRDPRLAALGGKMTLETLGSTTPTGDGLYVDDGGTNNAKVACIKNITATATAPTGDYPYGTLHLIY